MNVTAAAITAAENYIKRVESAGLDTIHDRVKAIAHVVTEAMCYFQNAHGERYDAAEWTKAATEAIEYIQAPERVAAIIAHYTAEQ
jgi:hypothetical protein